jgi:hypothetical protein
MFVVRVIAVVTVVLVAGVKFPQGIHEMFKAAGIL